MSGFSLAYEVYRFQADGPSAPVERMMLEYDEGDDIVATIVNIQNDHFGRSTHVQSLMLYEQDLLLLWDIFAGAKQDPVNTYTNRLYDRTHTDRGFDFHGLVVAVKIVTND